MIYTENKDLFDPNAKPVKKFVKSKAALSNFYPIPITYRGYTFACSEHAYQAAKLKHFDKDPAFKQFLETDDPYAVRKLGQDVEIREDWAEVKEDIMMEILRIKFAIPEMREVLLSTKRAYLRETVSVSKIPDTYWAYFQPRNKYQLDIPKGGQNKLGILLMHLREEIRAEEADK